MARHTPRDGELTKRHQKKPRNAEAAAHPWYAADFTDRHDKCPSAAYSLPSPSNCIPLAFEDRLELRADNNAIRGTERMRIPRIYHPAPLAAGVTVELAGDAANHIARVLRLSVGAPLVLFNGDGAEYAAVIAALDKRRVATEVAAHHRHDRDSPLDLWLAQGLSRARRNTWACGAGRACFAPKPRRSRRYLPCLRVGAILPDAAAFSATCI